MKMHMTYVQDTDDNNHTPAVNCSSIYSLTKGFQFSAVSAAVHGFEVVASEHVRVVQDLAAHEVQPILCSRRFRVAMSSGTGLAVELLIRC